MFHIGRCFPLCSASVNNEVSSCLDNRILWLLSLNVNLTPCSVLFYSYESANGKLAACSLSLHD